MCSINVTFTPDATGNRTATITIHDNASDSPQVVSLEGRGMDISLAIVSGSSATQTGLPGQTATYNLQFVPAGEQPQIRSAPPSRVRERLRWRPAALLHQPRPQPLRIQPSFPSPCEPLARHGMQQTCRDPGLVLPQESWPCWPRFFLD
jgi:hypothetical protein